MSHNRRNSSLAAVSRALKQPYDVAESLLADGQRLNDVVDMVTALQEAVTGIRPIPTFYAMEESNDNTCDTERCPDTLRCPVTTIVPISGPTLYIEE